MPLYVSEDNECLREYKDKSSKVYIFPELDDSNTISVEKHQEHFKIKIYFIEFWFYIVPLSPMITHQLFQWLLATFVS